MFINNVDKINFNIFIWVNRKYSFMCLYSDPCKHEFITMVRSTYKNTYFIYNLQVLIKWQSDQ